MMTAEVRPGEGEVAIDGESRKRRASRSARAVAKKTTTARLERARGRHALAVVGTEEKLERLVDSLGSNRVADLLDVSRSQPSRWRSRAEGIAADNERRLLDLEYVMSRLLRLYPPAVADTWLASHNAHLGARPIDVLKTSGALPVVQAIDAEEQGAFA
jgi:hypothetical protein